MIKKRLIKLLSHGKKYIAYQIAWQWISLLAQIAMIYAVTILLEQVLYRRENIQEILSTLLIVVLGTGVRFLCEKLAARASYQASRDVKIILRDRIYEKLLKLGSSYRERVSTSEVVQMAAEGVEQLEIYFGRYLSQLIYSLLAPITLFVILSQVNFKASVVLLICVPLIPISIICVQKIAKKLLSKYWGIYTGLGDSFLENLQGLTTLKIYQADQMKSDEMDENAEKFRKITMKVLTMQLNSTSVMDIVAYGGAAVGMIMVLKEYAAGNVGLAGTVMIILLASEFFIPLRVLGSYFHIAMNGMAASDKIFALLDLEEPEEKTLEIKETEVNIHMKSLRFSYEADREILKGINLELKAGSFTALVGTSGCGKSTIAGILMGRNQNYLGNIQINEKELSDIREESIMNHFTFIGHNSYLFKGSIRDNLRMAMPDATDDMLIEVLKKVDIWAFLEDQKGLDTELLEKGSNFSGGQCQRIALGRALLHDSAMYIFDEATSNIDVESEERIMEVIHELAKTKTVLLISHRLANVVAADSIYMLHQGEIAEHGTHEVLMGNAGAYKELYQQQKDLEDYGKVVS